MYKIKIRIQHPQISFCFLFDLNVRVRKESERNPHYLWVNGLTSWHLLGMVLSQVSERWERGYCPRCPTFPHTVMVSEDLESWSKGKVYIYHMTLEILILRWFERWSISSTFNVKLRKERENRASLFLNVLQANCKKIYFPLICRWSQLKIEFSHFLPKCCQCPRGVASSLLGQLNNSPSQQILNCKSIREVEWIFPTLEALRFLSKHSASLNV